jgi:hypothetical protein
MAITRKLPSVKALWINVFPKYHPLLKPTPIWKGFQVRAEATDFISPIIQDRSWSNNQKRTPNIFFLHAAIKLV